MCYLYERRILTSLLLYAPPRKNLSWIDWFACISILLLPNLFVFFLFDTWWCSAFVDCSISQRTYQSLCSFFWGSMAVVKKKKVFEMFTLCDTCKQQQKWRFLVLSSSIRVDKNYKWFVINVIFAIVVHFIRMTGSSYRYCTVPLTYNYLNT